MLTDMILYSQTSLKDHLSGACRDKKTYYWLPSPAEAIVKNRNFSIKIILPGDLMLISIILYSRASLKDHWSGAWIDKKMCILVAITSSGNWKRYRIFYWNLIDKWLDAHGYEPLHSGIVKGSFKWHFHRQENITYCLPLSAVAIGKDRNFSIKIMLPGDLMLISMILYSRASLRVHLSGAFTGKKALHFGYHLLN